VSQPEGLSYGDYCSVKLILHHPFIDWEDLLSVDGQIYESHIHAFQACTQSHTHPDDFYMDPMDPEAECSNFGNESDDEHSDDPQPDEERPLADFEAFTHRRPQEDFTRVDFLDSLGTREMDRSYDWSVHVGRYDIIIEGQLWTHHHFP
jgi:hypothetical protein